MTVRFNSFHLDGLHSQKFSLKLEFIFTAQKNYATWNYSSKHVNVASMSTHQGLIRKVWIYNRTAQ